MTIPQRVATEAGTATKYDWNTVEVDHPMPLIARQRIIGRHMMVSRVRLAAGSDVPTHAHDNEQLVCVVSGRLRLGLGAVGAPEHREVTVGPGEVLHLPPGVHHSARALEDTVVLDLFSPTSERTGLDGLAAPGC